MKAMLCTKVPATSASRQYELKIGNAQVTAAHLSELLDVVPGTEVIGSWASRFAEGQAAMTSHKVGKGNVIYLGTYLSDALVEVRNGVTQFSTAALGPKAIYLRPPSAD